MVIATSAALALGASGCTGKEADPTSTRTSATSMTSSATSTTSSSTSTTASSTSSSTTTYVPVKPTLPAAAKEHTDAGAVAFVKYYLDVVNYAWTKPDPDMIEPISLKKCSSCGNYATVAEKLASAREHYVGPVLESKKLLHVVTVGQETNVVGDVRLFASEIEDKNGRRRQAQQAELLRLGFELAWEGSWLMKVVSTI